MVPTEGHPTIKGQASLMPLSPQHLIFLVLRARTKLCSLGKSGKHARGQFCQRLNFYAPGNGTLHLSGHLSGGEGEQERGGNI